MDPTVFMILCACIVVAVVLTVWNIVWAISSHGFWRYSRRNVNGRSDVD